MERPALRDDLLAFFNRCLAAGRVPGKWAEREVVAIYKKSDPTLPKNYRPITLLDTLYKIYTRMLALRLSDAVEPYLKKSQYGFRRHRSTVHAIHVVRRTFDALCHKSHTDLNLLLCDWNKAFDKVDREELWKAFQQQLPLLLGILAEYQELYSSVEYRLAAPDGACLRFLVPHGVRQGSVEGPVLFIIAYASVPR